MKVAKKAVQYYTTVTGKTYDDFYSNLDLALAQENASGELWLIKELMKVVTKNGISIEEFKANKDAIRGTVDADKRKQEGEFYTPLLWCEEGRKYFDKHIPDWHNYTVWDASCYTMDTELLTERGWVSYDTLKDTDKVFALNPETLETEFVGFGKRFKKKADKFLEIELQRETSFCGYSYTDKISLKVTLDHKMFAKINGELKFLCAEEFYHAVRGSFYVPQGGKAYTVEIPVYTKDYEHYNDEEVVRFVPVSLDSCKLINDEEQDVWDITLDKHHVFLVRRDGAVCFCGNCGTGNLMRTSGHSGDKLFLSTLRKEDADAVQKTFPSATVFPLNFLDKLDYDDANLEFFSQLPPRLQEVIRNDEPLIFYMNPPYKAGSARDTDVGRHMCDIGLGKPACDIYYQFMWRVMNLVERFRLSNTYFNCFGPLTFFTGVSAGLLLAEFEHCFEFVDGMCLSAQEFSDTSESILWGIGCTLWKARGGYQPDQLHKDILLERKFKGEDGTIQTSGRVLYVPPREKLSDWVKPEDVIRYVQAPLMTSQVTFKGSELDEKVAPQSGKLAVNALGTLMIGNTLTRSADQSAILSMPTTIQYTSITEENFWRCVSSFTFRRIYLADWSVAKKEISAPLTTVEGYDKWLMNALVMFLFEWKSMMSSLRNVEFNGEKVTIRNKLFYCTAEEIANACEDERILEDIRNNPPANEFMLAQIEKARPYWVEEVAQLFDFCKGYTLKSINQRKDFGYKCSTDTWDAGFHQIRGCVWNDELEAEMSERVAKARDWLRKSIDEFGFVNREEE